ncbi:hypothetical protein [Actinoallomurus sp. NPDC052274]|uniref:hypothetical protein n=1 Tax=Actinoallomurus sp. NPDC052274 TaxID=3155420 RepID=UPI003423D0B3
MRSDPSPAELAAIQAAAPNWLVMWCWYPREYAALAKFGAEPTIIYDRDPRQLLRHCQEVELAAAHGGPVIPRTFSGPKSAQTPYGRSPP